jgi:hypothetical protein
MEEKKEERKETLKEIFFNQLRIAFEDLVKKTVNVKSLGVVIIIWFLLSVTASIFRRIAVDENGVTLCKRTVQLDSFLFGKLLCPIN